jgi:hypothetical protein
VQKQLEGKGKIGFQSRTFGNYLGTTSIDTGMFFQKQYKSKKVKFEPSKLE